LIITLTMALSIMLSAITPSAATQIASPTAHAEVAGLVIDYGNGSVTYALIPIAEDAEISGLALLEQSELPLLMLDSGGYGTAICKIVTVGCELSACRARLCQTAERSSPYWQYYQLAETGDWKSSALGASSSRVTAGDVDAWMWLGGTSTPTDPGLSIDEIAALLEVDPATTDEPVVRTFGDLPTDATPASTAAYLGAGAIIAAIVALGGGAWWRMHRLGAR